MTNKSPTPAEAKFDTHFVLLVESFSPLFSVYSLFASVRCILVDLIIWTSNQIKLRHECAMFDCRWQLSALVKR